VNRISPGRETLAAGEPGEKRNRLGDGRR
jgi:hypothetical protein